MCAPAVEEALLAQRLEEFGASPEGQALLGDEALRFGRHSFAEAVAAAQQPEDTTPAARGALVESLADGLKAAADGAPLRAAFFVSCHFLLNGGGPAQRGAAAQRLDLLTGSREAFSQRYLPLYKVLLIQSTTNRFCSQNHFVRVVLRAFRLQSGLSPTAVSS